MLALLTIAIAAQNPLLPGMGSFHRPVTTSNADAQALVNQGFTLAYAFMHDECISSFEAAAARDPELAIAHWGVALCHGPHINNPYMSPESMTAARAALNKAKSAKNASDVERALIDALAKRYVKDGSDDRAYADAMKRVMKKYPDDVDVMVLTAEALLDVHPWDLYEQNVKRKPKPWTNEIVKILEDAVKRAPTHPGANHLLVHSLEEGPSPDKARAAADTLRSLVPGAGHLLHMPAHIDARLGKWGDAVVANENAMAADAEYRRLREQRNGDVGTYASYIAHSPHHLAYVAMMDGQEAKALKAARAAIDALPKEFVDANAEAIDGYLAGPVEVLVRFGRWQQILEEPEPDERFRIRRALRRQARGIALAVLGRVDEARAELTALNNEMKLAGDRPFGMNKGVDVVKIAERMLAGEIDVKTGEAALKANANDAVGKRRLSEGIAKLREAVRAEDALRFDEPPPWTLPVRHALGAALLVDAELAKNAKSAVAAERVFREDLERHPENGWALTGLAKALRTQGKNDDAAAVDERVKVAFARADKKPTSSCECLP